ncbi:DUF427 domain-containing protein [Halomonas salinarum]|uniref:DUF427 domain-containing protein n=1 Tax=Halomonas salinarum TaxID=1158993 RepID=UPI0014388EDA|nr:DUF427 domain-containing protein [Halomonas salinarum]
MATASSAPRITLRPYDRRVRVRVGDTLIAGTTSAVECGYPLRQYLPHHDLRMNLLIRPETATIDPKGTCQQRQHARLLVLN